MNHMEGQLAPEDHRIPGLPTKLTMDDWEYAWRSHATNAFAAPSVKGVDNEETLSVSDTDGNVVAKLNMPRYKSFGVGATMTMPPATSSHGYVHPTGSSSSPSTVPHTESSALNHW